MKIQIQAPAAAAALLFLLSTATAQTLHFDGHLNSPVGSSTLFEDATGQLIVSNLGSSGLDGVRISLGDSQGGSVSPSMLLAPNESCTVEAQLGMQGTSTTLPVSLTMTRDQAGTGTLFSPDFSALGQQTYTLRVYKAMQLVYEEDDVSGQTRMSNIPLVLPEKVYLFLPDWVGGPNYPSFCGFVDGNVTPPGGGNPIAADVVEFVAQPGPIVSVASLEVRASGPSQFSVAQEEIRIFEHFALGLDDAHLRASNGTLIVDNLGSSGCDGVSIDLGSGSDGVSAEAQEIAAPSNTGMVTWMETTDSTGRTDRVMAEEVVGEWLFTPDFSEVGTSLYTLELYNAGQLVFQQSGMSGPAVSTASFTRFYKKTIHNPDGSVEVEWCIGGSSASQHGISGGPTLAADMFTLRSEGSTSRGNNLRSLRLRASDQTTDIVLTSVSDITAGTCVGTNYCIASPNSTGAGAVMCSSGSSSVAANDLVLSCTSLPLNQFGIFYYGPNQIQAAFGNGFRCVGGSTFRLPIISSGGTGTITHAFDNTGPSGQVSAGELWNFQCWYRDPAAGGANFNLSDGHSVLFTP